MIIQIPKKLYEIITNFQKNGFEIYIVGGAIRDILMGKPTYDWDLTTNATPQDMLEIFPDAYYDNQFGTVGIKNDEGGEKPYEITTFRTEYGYSDLRRPDKIIWGKSLSEDLERRDFTINAMAFLIRSRLGNPESKSIEVEVELIDLYQGQKDLEKRIIKAVGDPQKRFSEDALRMMRAVRIASELGFTIEENTFNAIRKKSFLINKIAKERVRDELLKIFKSPFPYEGMVLFRNSGLMKEVLPEMEETFGVEQKSPGRHHIYDVGTHSLLSLKNCPSQDPIVRLATFIHDSGKAKTYKKTNEGIITFYNHELVSTKIAYKISQRLKLSNKDSSKLTRLVRWHQFSVDERQTDSAIRRFIRNVGIENLKDILDLRIADRLGGGASQTSWRLEQFKKRLTEVQKQPFTVHDLKVNGHDVMEIFKIKPGPKVGEILDTLFKKAVEKKIENKREKLLDELKKMKNREN